MIHSFHMPHDLPSETIMKRISTIVASLALAFSASMWACAAEPTEQQLGFVAIADGKTFNGWKQDGNWVIDDGAFARVRPSGQLTYEAQLIPDDFELRFDWKVSKGCNSGVYYRPAKLSIRCSTTRTVLTARTHVQSAASIFFCMAPSKRAAKRLANGNTPASCAKEASSSIGSTNKRVLSFDYNDPKWSQYVELLRNPWW